MSARKKMSQREGREWKRRALYAERLANIRAGTPGHCRAVCTYTCTPEQEREWMMGEYFGASLRVEKNGRRFDVVVFRDPNAPIREAK